MQAEMQKERLRSAAEPFSYAALRRHGVERALARAGLTIAPQRNVKAPVPDPVAIANAAERLLLGPDRPTAVLGILDKYALAVLNAARDIETTASGASAGGWRATVTGAPSRTAMCQRSGRGSAISWATTNRWPFVQLGWIA